MVILQNRKDVLQIVLHILQIALKIVADDMCSLNRGTHINKVSGVAYINNAFNAWSYLSHPGLSAPGLPLIC